MLFVFFFNVFNALWKRILTFAFASPSSRWWGSPVLSALCFCWHCQQRGWAREMQRGETFWCDLTSHFTLFSDWRLWCRYRIDFVTPWEFLFLHCQTNRPALLGSAVWFWPWKQKQTNSNQDPLTHLGATSQLYYMVLISRWSSLSPVMNPTQCKANLGNSSWHPALNSHNSQVRTHQNYIQGG